MKWFMFALLLVFAVKTSVFSQIKVSGIIIDQQSKQAYDILILSNYGISLWLRRGVV